MPVNCPQILVFLDKDMSSAYIVQVFRGNTQQYRRRYMTKALISVTGLDTTGIIARVATKLADFTLQ